jgi:hypothetical protein
MTMPVDKPTEISAAMEQLTESALERLLSLYSASSRRRRRLDSRDEAIRALAARFYGNATEGRAAIIIQDIQRFAVTGFKNEPDEREDEKRKALRVVLNACMGRVPELRQFQRILAGKRTPPAT